MSSYTEFVPNLKTGHNIIVPKIYTNGKFLPIHIYIATDHSELTQFYTVDREAFITTDGDKFVVVGDGNVDTRITAYAGEAVAGYSIVGMR